MGPPLATPLWVTARAPEPVSWVKQFAPYNSVDWLGLKGYNLVALLLTALYLGLSLPLLIRYRVSPRGIAVVLVGSLLLIRGALWISGYS